MTIYNAESFYRAKIKTSITPTETCPITIKVSKLPNLSAGLMTINPNTKYEEMVEFNNRSVLNSTIDIIKRGINPSSTLLTTDGVDYNDTDYQFAHTDNDIIRGDVNHIHINQAVGNSTLATNTGVGISKLSVAAVSAGDPIVVGDNDPRVGDASITQKATVKLSVAPVSAIAPIAVGDNDPRLAPTDATLIFTDITTNNVSTSFHGFAPKSPNNADVFLNGAAAYSRAMPSGATITWLTNTAPSGWLLADGSAVSRTTYATLFSAIGTVFGTGDGSTTFNLPNLKGRVIVGRDSAQTEFDTLGESGGAKTHTLSEAELPAHSHTLPAANGSSGGSGSSFAQASSPGNGSNFVTSNTGSGSPHNNLQPYLVLNYIIKT